MTDINYNRKGKDSDYMKEYKKKRIVDKGISKEDREKNNQYMKSYSARKKVLNKVLRLLFQSFMTLSLKGHCIFVLAVTKCSTNIVYFRLVI